MWRKEDLREEANFLDVWHSIEVAYYSSIVLTHTHEFIRCEETRRHLNIGTLECIYTAVK